MSRDNTDSAMSISKNLYIDSYGVQRGYYVYIHKDCDTRAVFYVDKGHGRRAWDAARRNDNWENHVATLRNGWVVEIVRDNLSEIEAFDLEAELVEEYGGSASEGGVLTNWLPGGEAPVSVGFTVHMDDNGWSAAYYNAREFNDLSRREQEVIADSAIRALNPIAERLSDLDDKAAEDDDDELSESVNAVEIEINGILEASMEFKGRRISWKDLGMAMEEAVEILESELEDIEEHHPKIRPSLIKALELSRPILRAMDSGNRGKAEEIADRTAE